MLSLRNTDMLKESASAQRTFRRLHRANVLTYILLGVIALLGVWNVITVIAAIRGSTTDLADADSVLGHISTRLIWVVAVVTVALFIFKEWRWGERSFASVFFLAGLLFLTLVPVMSAEIEPKPESTTMELTYFLCEPGGLEGSTLIDESKCTQVPDTGGDAYLSASNPVNGGAEWLEPTTIQRGITQWRVEARGSFRVYFLLKQESLEACESARMATSLPPDDQSAHHCLEENGSAWMVIPFVTSTTDSGYLTVYQESAP